MIYSLDQIPAENVGGKAQNLMRLMATFAIPAGFVVTADEADNEVILAEFDRLGATYVAVRSSGLNEDGKEASWAGQLETFLTVTRENLIDSIEKCRVSNHSVRAESYASTHGTTGNVAVIVQRMVEARASGVAFSDHPVTGRETPVIEAVSGLGDSLVSGEVTPDTYIVADAIETHLASHAPVLDETEVMAVADLVRQVKAALGYPVDIEWAYEGSTLYLLQARPITTLHGGRR